MSYSNHNEPSNQAHPFVEFSVSTDSSLSPIAHVILYPNTARSPLNLDTVVEPIQVPKPILKPTVHPLIPINELIPDLIVQPLEPPGSVQQIQVSVPTTQPDIRPTPIPESNPTEGFPSVKLPDPVVLPRTDGCSCKRVDQDQHLADQVNLQIESRFIDSNGNLLLKELLAYNKSCRRPGVKETLIKVDHLGANCIGWTRVTLPDKGLLIGKRAINRDYHWKSFDVKSFEQHYENLFRSKKTSKTLFEECSGVVLAGGFLVNYIASQPNFHEPGSHSNCRRDNPCNLCRNCFNSPCRNCKIYRPDIDLFLIQENSDRNLLKKRVNQIIGWIRQNHGISGNPFVTDNAVTVIDSSKQEWQIILRQYSTMDEILWGFDLACCQLLYDGKHLYTTEPGLLAFKYNITLVEPEDAWYYCFESRIYKYMDERGFFFYFWFIRDPWPIDCTSNSGIFLDKTTGVYQRIGPESHLNIIMPYLNINGLTPLIPLESAEYQMIEMLRNAYHKDMCLRKEFKTQETSMKLVRNNSLEKRESIDMTVWNKMVEQMNDIIKQQKENRDLINQMEKLYTSHVANRLKYTRVAIGSLSNKDHSGSNRIECLLKGKVSKPRFRSGDSDYQIGGIVYHNLEQLTWTNLKALDRLLKGKPAYRIGYLRGELEDEVDIFLDENFINAYCNKWVEALRYAEIQYMPEKTIRNFQLILGEEAAKIQTFFPGPRGFDFVSPARQVHLERMKHLMKFPVKFQTVMTGTVIAGKADPGRGKTLEEWAGSWLNKKEI